jgi:hypothetical protein
MKQMQTDWQKQQRQLLPEYSCTQWDSLPVWRKRSFGSDVVDQEEINREHAEAIAAITTGAEETRQIVEATRASVIDIQKEIRENNHGLRNILHAQQMQLSRMEIQLTALTKIQVDLYGSADQRGMISRVQRLEDSLEPIRKIMYGAVGLCLVAIVGSILALVLKKA